MPLSQFLPVGQSELRQCIRHMIFDCVDTDSSTFGDFAAGQSVLNRVNDPPFGGCQQIVVRRSTAARESSHRSMVIRADPIYPPPG